MGKFLWEYTWENLLITWSPLAKDLEFNRKSVEIQNGKILMGINMGKFIDNVVPPHC